ncbi:MAG TPA: asparagine synthase (glutamine-hydrolyzing) [Clostridia bacterium]|nr:asparagine synthase (glutamine-hydrolyzing) [Clostridia bacterium]
MCGIAGFCNIKADYINSNSKWQTVLNHMKQSLEHRGPDEEGDLLLPQVGLAQRRLSIIDLNNGQQPMSRKRFGHTYSIVYNGELYNTAELRESLISMGYSFETRCDTEVVLIGYMALGREFVKQMNGIFAFAIWDSYDQSLFLARDRLGVKPLFYTILEDTFVFGSEIKALFEYPGFKPRIDAGGLCEVFGLGPAKTYGLGVFKDVYEILPGNILVWNHSGLHESSYWRLVSAPHEDSFEATVEKTAFLLTDAVKRQMVSDIPICTFLSGGVDSSLITAICANELKTKNKQIETYSFDFVDNAKNFKSSSFQPAQDRPYVDMMVESVNSKHTYLECDSVDLADHLYDAVNARDLPNMADVESSLLYFCRRVAAKNKVALTGECADEIFGGYPWFHNPELLSSKTFPWSRNMATRKLLLSDDLLSTIDLDGYVQATYEKSVAETPRLIGESVTEVQRREIAYLNLKWFMITLLDRMDRCSMYSGLEARVPFADHRIIEYVWNVPWEMKCPNGVVKGLLREAGKGLVPNEILYRRKSPYPKTYNPDYEKLLGNRLLEVLADPNAPIHPLVDRNKISAFLSASSDYGKPWYGQLMAGPQQIAYLLQVNYWLKKYRIELV